jgi:hypothetical protein
MVLEILPEVNKFFLQVAANASCAPGLVTYEGMPSDWYLRLTGEGAKLLRGERKNTGRIPIKR